jgi:hypothetical protein
VNSIRIKDKQKTSFCLIIIFLSLLTLLMILFMKAIRNSNTNATRKELWLNLNQKQAFA